MRVSPALVQTCSLNQNISVQSGTNQQDAAPTELSLIGAFYFYKQTAPHGAILINPLDFPVPTTPVLDYDRGRDRRYIAGILIVWNE